MEIDLADRLDDLICTFDKAVGDGPSDIVVAIFGWLVFAAGIFLAIGYIINNLRRSLSTDRLDAITGSKLLESTEELTSKNGKNISNTHVKTKHTEYQGNISTNGNIDINTLPNNSRNESIKAVAPEDGDINRKRSFSALDPREFSNPKERENDSSNPHEAETKPPEKEHLDSDLNGFVLLNGKDSITCDESIDKEETSSFSFVPPISLGADNESVDWVNLCLVSMFTTPSIHKKLISMWLSSLSSYTKSSESEDETSLEFLNIMKGSKPPTISNMTTQSHPGDNMTITADISIESVSIFAHLMHEIVQKRSVGTYDVCFQLDSLKGRLNLAVLTRERLVIAKLDGWPQVKARLINTGARKKVPFLGGITTGGTTEQTLQNLCDIGKDLSIAAIRGAQVTINLEEDFSTSEGGIHEKKPFIPVFVRSNQRCSSPILNSEHSPDLPRKSFHTSKESSKNEPVLSNLRVKVVKATQIGTVIKPRAKDQHTSVKTRKVYRPYVIIEIDDPGQRNQTNDVELSDTTSDTPQWNQEFSFNITSKTSEILFEVWDGGKEDNKSAEKKDAFLGLGIVSVEELHIASTSRHVIPLQGRPYYGTDDDDENNINGLLTVEFVLIDKMYSRKVKPTLGTTEKHTTSRIKEQDPQMSPTTNRHRPRYKTDMETVEEKDIGDYSGVENSTNGLNGENLNGQYLTVKDHLKRADNSDLSLSTDQDTGGSLDRAIYSNKRKKKRNLVSKIRHRFTTSASPSPSDKVRPLSSGVMQSSDAHESRGRSWEFPNSSLNVKFLSGIRSISADRFKSRTERQRNASGSLRSGMEDGTSMSDLSGISSASAKTYITEESSLVLECTENGVVRHYSIPYHLAKRGRLRKKGTRLHIYLDHLFVARWIRGGTQCDACVSAIPLRFGKHGYVCRDCAMTVHKPCHVKVTDHCMETSLPAMDLLLYDDQRH